MLRPCRALARLALAVSIIGIWATFGYTQDAFLHLSRATDADTLVGDVELGPIKFVDDIDDPPGGSADGTHTYAWDVAVIGDAFYIPTVILKNQRIRVAGCNAYELNTDKGKAAKVAVEKLVFGKKIKLTPRGKDNFGRLLAIVTLVDDKGKETILADWLIKNGHGVEYKR